MSTMIQTDGVGEIDSDNYWGFVLRPFQLPPMESDRQERLDTGVKLMACRTMHVEHFLSIATFFHDDYDKAVDALASLLRAVKRGDQHWDVRDYL